MSHDRRFLLAVRKLLKTFCRYVCIRYHHVDASMGYRKNTLPITKGHNSKNRPETRTRRSLFNGHGIGVATYLCKVRTYRSGVNKKVAPSFKIERGGSCKIPMSELQDL